MKIGVCLKQVPDAEARLRLNERRTWIDEEDLPFVINESDECALEAAIQLVEAHGGEVIVFTLGPQRCTEALRKAFALGANQAVHLCDPAFDGGDPVSNGLALAAALQRPGMELDLVLAGSQSDDAGYGATASIVAANLDWPHAWLVMGIELVEGESVRSVRIVRELEGGQNELSRIALPAVIEVQAGINHPRYASLRGIMAAKKKPIELLSVADLNVDPSSVGAAGARIEIVSVAFPEREGGVELLEGDPAAASKKLVEKLALEARVL